MIVCIAELLSEEALKSLRGILGKGRYVDGKQTAGWHARLVKDNRQLAGVGGAGGAAARAQVLVMKALEGNELFRGAALPARIGPLLFSRYEPGMSYGSHVDDAIMGSARDFRADVSFTVFLNDTADYDGGELVVESTASEAEYKLDAGAAIVYPSTSLHRVAPVIRGRREVAVGWAQSLVRDAGRREILFDLETARREIFREQGKTRSFDLLSKSYSNLLRLWAET